MRVIYADLAFFLNSLLDYLALCCTVHLTGLPKRQLRLILASLVGGLYGVFALIGGWNSAFLPWLAAFLMVYLTFGWDRWFLRRYVLFLAVSCALSGAATAAEALLVKTNHPLPVFAAASVFCFFALSVVFRGGGKENAGRVRAELLYEGRKIRLTLLRDSGNTLTDPVTGNVLCVIWSKALSPLLAGRQVHFHRIGYRSLGTEREELLYFYCDAITVDGVTHYHYPIGLAKHALSDGSGFVGLWGEKVKGEGSNVSFAQGKIT